MCIYGYKTRVALPIRERKLENKKFKYIEVGAEEFFKPSAIIWIRDNDLTKDKQLINLLKKNSNDNNYEDGYELNYLEFPMKNVDLIQVSEKHGKHYVLTKGDKNLYYIVVNAPRGGKSEIIDANRFVNKAHLFKFKEYKSRTGKLGISTGALILTKQEEITIKWTREKDGKKEGKVSINIDGDVIEEEFETTEETTSE
jgi:uncharacterized C2H2 Zn-finger protein